MPVNKSSSERLLKTARGQIDGILKMVEDGRYCMDIANQLLSLEAIIKKCRREVLQNHLRTCVKDAKNEKDLDQKIDELIRVLEKLD